MCQTTPTAALQVVLATQYRATGNNARAVENLAGALRQAEVDHKLWETEHGSDPSWPTWYAKYLLGLDVTPEGHDHATDTSAITEGYGVGW